MKLLLSRIVKIPKKLQNRVLTQYVMRTRDLYQIAFFQWRKKFPSKIRYDINEIEELLESRIEYQFTRNRVNMDKHASADTQY